MVTVQTMVSWVVTLDSPYQDSELIRSYYKRMQSQRIILPDNFNINLLRKFHTNLSLHLEDNTGCSKGNSISPLCDSLRYGLQRTHYTVTT